MFLFAWYHFIYSCKGTYNGRRQPSPCSDFFAKRPPRSADTAEPSPRSSTARARAPTRVADPRHALYLPLRLIDGSGDLMRGARADFHFAAEASVSACLTAGAAVDMLKLAGLCDATLEVELLQLLEERNQRRARGA
ncbi:unnamed protein product [Urochloa humidicola]